MFLTNWAVGDSSLLLLSLTVYDQCSFASRDKAVSSLMLSMDRLVQHQILLKLGGSSPLHCDRVVARQVQFLFPFQRKYRFCDLYAIPGVGTHQSWSHSMHCQWTEGNASPMLFDPSSLSVAQREYRSTELDAWNIPGGLWGGIWYLALVICT